MVNEQEKYFIFNGRKSSDFGVWASGSGVMVSPQKRREEISVPGRSGDLIIEDGSFENVELEFKDCFIPTNFTQHYGELKNYLYRQKGYKRLELSWLPDEYRLAAFEGDIEPSLKGWNGYGSFDLVFNCKPQRFLKSGDEPYYISPPLFMGTEMLTPVYYVGSQSTEEPTKIIVTVLHKPAHNLTINVIWNSGESSEQTHSYTATSTGQVITDEFVGNPANCRTWRVTVVRNNADSADDINIVINACISLSQYGESPRRDISFSRVLNIGNETGFVCEPLFVVYGNLFPIDSVLAVGEDGVTDQWDIHCDDYSDLTNETYIDCGNDYYYGIADGQKVNITNYLTITHTDSDGNTLPQSFPHIGETGIHIYLGGTGTSREGSLVLLYPNWFTL